MTSERIKEIQATTGYPDSVSIKQALLQVWNECEQSHPSPMSASDMTARDYFDGEGSPLTLSKICNDEEKEFLLQHIELYASGKVHQSKQPPMSAEQVEELGYYYPLFKFFSDEHGLSLLDSQLQDVIHECKKFIEPASPSVKADGWVSVEDELPKVGQKVDLWLVPDDEEKSYRMTWTWEKESTARITINGCKVTHWQPFAPPKQQL